jgi:hypothetical protein
MPSATARKEGLLGGVDRIYDVRSREGVCRQRAEQAQRFAHRDARADGCRYNRHLGSSAREQLGRMQAVDAEQAVLGICVPAYGVQQTGCPAERNGVIFSNGHTRLGGI